MNPPIVSQSLNDVRAAQILQEVRNSLGSKERHRQALVNLQMQSKVERKMNQESYMKIRQYRFKKER